MPLAMPGPGYSAAAPTAPGSFSPSAAERSSFRLYVALTSRLAGNLFAPLPGPTRPPPLAPPAPPPLPPTRSPPCRAAPISPPPPIPPVPSSTPSPVSRFLRLSTCGPASPASPTRAVPATLAPPPLELGGFSALVSASALLLRCLRHPPPLVAPAPRVSVFAFACALAFCTAFAPGRLR